MEIMEEIQWNSIKFILLFPRSQAYLWYYPNYTYKPLRIKYIDMRYSKKFILNRLLLYLES